MVNLNKEHCSFIKGARAYLFLEENYGIFLIISKVKVHLDTSYLDNWLNFSFYYLCDCSSEDNSFIFILFFSFEREREHLCSWAEEWQRERILSRFHAQHGASSGARSHNLKIMSWVKIKSETLSQLSHPGASTNTSFREILFSCVVLYVEGTKVRGSQRVKILFSPKGNRKKIINNHIKSLE